MNSPLRAFSLCILVPLAACGLPIDAPQSIATPRAVTPYTSKPSTPRDSIGTPTVNFIVQSSSVLPQLPGSAHPTGVIATTPDEQFTGSLSELFDLSTRTRKELPGSEGGVYTAGVSPDGTSVAFMSYQPDFAPRLVIVDNKGRLLLDEDPGDPDLWLVTWHPSGELLLERSARRQTSNMAAYPFTMVSLDIATGSRHELPPDFPNMFVPATPLPMSWEEFGAVQVVYDPEMGLAVYPTDLFARTARELVLFDLVDRRRIAGIPAVCFGGDSPRWSPDGVGVVLESYPLGRVLPYEESCLTNLEELFFLSREGIPTQLTFMTQDFDQVDIGPRMWSPDARRIAFWMRTSPDAVCEDAAPKEAGFSEIPDRLAVLDLESGIILAHCLRRPYSIQDASGGSIVLVPEAPMWSPDSRYLLVQVESEGRAILTIVDPFEMWAAEISENARPVAWMVSD